MIGGEHHAVLAERRERAIERLGRAHARSRDDDVLPDVLRRRLFEFEAMKLGAAAEAPQQERQRLAEVAQHQPAAREAVEMSADDEPQRVRAGLETPAP